MHITTLIGESIKAAEEDIDSLQQQRTVEDGRVGLSEIEEKDTIAQKLITEENDELKLIQSNCRTDLDSISKIITLYDTHNVIHYEKGHTP